MSAMKTLEDLRKAMESGLRLTCTSTASKTLTDAELAANFAIISAVSSSQTYSLTLPAASAANVGQLHWVALEGAGTLTLTCSAGFGGGSTSSDVITFTAADEGDSALIFSCKNVAGTYSWYVIHSTVAA